MQDYLKQAPCVINVGLAFFAEDLKYQSVEAAQVDWAPPVVLDIVREDTSNADSLLDGLM